MTTAEIVKKKLFKVTFKSKSKRHPDWELEVIAFGPVHAAQIARVQMGDMGEDYRNYKDPPKIRDMGEVA